MTTEFLGTIPVLSSADISRDIVWYREKTGFEEYFSGKMHAVLYQENIIIH